MYKAGFYKGTMLVGKYAGRSVEYAKPLVRADLLANGEAAIYFEPESPVMSRTGNDCVISCEDQWYLTYGEPRWKEIVEKHVESEAFTLYNSETRRDFKNALGWLKEWGCARQFGLGTQVNMTSAHIYLLFISFELILLFARFFCLLFFF